MKKAVFLFTIVLFFSCNQETFEVPEADLEDAIQFILNQDLPEITNKIYYGHVVPGEFPGYDCEGLSGICAIVANLEGSGPANILNIDLELYDGTNAKARYVDPPFGGMTELEVFEGSSMSDEFIEQMGLNSATIVPGIYPIVITEDSSLGELTFELIVD